MGVPLYAELRYWPELAGLLADRRFHAPGRAPARPPVLLIPGFLAGDASLVLLAGWLRRRGHRVRLSGIRINTDCSGRELSRLEAVLATFDEPAILIGQSRGGTFARALAAVRQSRSSSAPPSTPVYRVPAKSGQSLYTRAVAGGYLRIGELSRRTGVRLNNMSAKE